MENLEIIKTLAIDNSLSVLRDRTIGMVRFRENADNLIAKLMEEIGKKELVGDKKSMDFGIVVILRSAVVMLMPTLKNFPDAKVGFAGIRRDELTALPQEYYWKMPSDISDKTILIPDPMLATGGSMIYAISKLKKARARDIRIVSLISAPEGVGAIHKFFPEVKIYISSLDKGLDKDKYIVPGLGDFGDRYFGTG